MAEDIDIDRSLEELQSNEEWQKGQAELADIQGQIAEASSEARVDQDRLQNLREQAEAPSV